MKLRVILGFFSLFLFISYTVVSGQVDSLVGQITNSAAESFATSMSGNGRFVVFESRGNVATVNPRNADGNREIFLFDYAQRQIFQITNTKSVLFNPNLSATFNNIRVEVANVRPVISNDGRWIAFSSNATTSRPAQPDSTNPSDFDGNAFTSPTPTPSPSPSPTGSPTPTPTPAYNPLQDDGNLEMWLYEIPAYPAADLTTGEEIAFVNLNGGSFTRVTNTDPSRLPIPGTAFTGPFIADDNHDASISDDGNVIAFVSTRDLVTGGNPFPDADNDEIFTYVRGSATVSQVTQTPRGPITNPIYNKNPTISGDGTRVVFASTGDNPIIGMTGGNNPESSRNEEIFISDLSAAGEPTGIRRQLTVTTPTNPGDVVNMLDLGRRMSRDGRYVAFDSYADLANEHSGTNQTAFALFVYDLQNPTTPVIRRVAPRSNSDSEAQGGDVQRYPGFTDYDGSGTATTLLIQTRMNITSAGVMPTNENDGLNPLDFRPPQLYSYDLDATPANARFTRLAKFPVPSTFLASSQPIPSERSNRIAFNMAISELGTGNFDGQSEAYYLYTPEQVNRTTASYNFATGASKQAVSPTVVPTPSPTPTPTATPTPTPTPTPSPSPSPTGSPTPTPTPTPTTPPAVFGISPGMLAYLNFDTGLDEPVVARTAVGSLNRRFTLPIELSGVSVSINGVACGIKSVSRRQILLVVPPGLNSAVAGTEFDMVVNVGGNYFKGKAVVVPTRPDIFSSVIGPGGRAQVTNVTNRVPTTEPFNTFTIQLRGGRRVPSRLRLRMTGVENAGASNFRIRIGSLVIFPTNVLTGAVVVEPGVQTVDFTVTQGFAGIGDQPIIVEIDVGSTTFRSRLDDTAPRIAFN